MSIRRFQPPALRRVAVAAAVLLNFAFAAGSALSAEGINADADKILKSMSSYLGGLKAFSVKADIDNEIIMNDGLKLQLSSSATIVMERPEKIQLQRNGMFGGAEVLFNGKTLTVYGKGPNVYLQKEVSGTIDDAIRALESDIGIDAPGADLFFANTYPILSSGVGQGEYIGTAYVDGVECHHLAFRKSKVDWQLWVKTGAAPLPMKYVITSKWMTGAPQYSIRLRDWNTKPQIKSDQFTFIVPKGAKKIDAIAVNEMGEITPTMEGK